MSHVVYPKGRGPRSGRKPSRFIGTSFDSRSFLASIVESSDAAIIGSTLDEGMIISWNRGAEQMYGYTAAEAIGQSVRLIVPPDRHGEVASIIDRIRRGERVSHFEAVRMHKNGTLLNIILIVSPVKDENGKVVGLSSISRDVTEHVRVGRQVQLMAQVLDQVRAAAVATDMDGRVTLWNTYAEQLFGWQGTNVIGQPLTDTFLRPQDFAYFLGVFEAMKATGYWEGDLNLWRKDGTSFPAHAISTMVLGPDGRHIGMAAIISDISDLKMYEARLQESAATEATLVEQLTIAREAERRRLARDIHDGPLQAMGVALLTASRALTRMQRGQLEHVEAEVRMLQDELRGAVAEVRTVLSDLSLDVLNTQGLQEALHGQVARFSGVTGIRVQLSTSLFGHLPGNMEVLIYRLVQEALANIRKHSQATTAWVEIKSDRGRLALNISDNGRGFDLEEAQNDHRDGWGIGLRSMRERIQAVGGEMKISTQRGEGTILSFWCPLPKEPAGADEPPDGRTSHGADIVSPDSVPV